MSSSVCHAPLPARMEAFTTRFCLRAVDQYERLLQTRFNKVRAHRGQVVCLHTRMYAGFALCARFSLSLSFLSRVSAEGAHAWKAVFLSSPLLNLFLYDRKNRSRKDVLEEIREKERSCYYASGRKLTRINSG